MNLKESQKRTTQCANRVSLRGRRPFTFKQLLDLGNFLVPVASQRPQRRFSAPVDRPVSSATSRFSISATAVCPARTWHVISPERRLSFRT
jgi:hypothetical protein